MACMITAAAIDKVLELAATIAAQERSLEAQILNDSLASWDAV